MFHIESHAEYVQDKYRSEAQQERLVQHLRRQRPTNMPHRSRLALWAGRLPHGLWALVSLRQQDSGQEMSVSRLME